MKQFIADLHIHSKYSRATSKEMDLENLSFEGISSALSSREAEGLTFTIEFFPQERKYHYSGHRACETVLSPQETRLSQRCPKCGSTVTLGAMHRQADREC